MKDNVEESVNYTLEAIGEWHNARNLIDGSDDKAQTVKLGEEFGELCAAVARGDKPKLEDSIGDMLVVLKNIALRNNLTMSKCAMTAYTEIAPRKGRMIDGVFVKEEDLPT